MINKTETNSEDDCIERCKEKLPLNITFSNIKPLIRSKGVLRTISSDYYQTTCTILYKSYKLISQIINYDERI